MAELEQQESAGTCDSSVANRLLLLDDPGELKRLSQHGWFRPIAPNKWFVVDLVHGRIKQLVALASTYGAPQMAGVLALTAVRVRQLTDEGILKTVAKGRYNRDDTARDYINWLRGQNKLANRTTSESRVREARATEIEIRTAERTRELISLDEALESNALLVGYVRTEFGGLAARITRDLTLRREIEKAVNGSLARIADRLNEEAENLAAGRVADEAVADDAAGRVGEAQPELPADIGTAGSA